MSDYQIVFFDLETTGLDTSICDIIQLSAISGDRGFDFCTLPDRPIDAGAARITGFSIRDDQLYRGEDRMDTIPLAEALTSFIEFLESFDCPVLLAAHNAKGFDAPVLARVLRQLSLMQEFEDVVIGFLDTLMLSRILHPNLDSYKQVNLVKRFLGTPYDAHNATDDTRMLQELLNTWRPDTRSVKGATFEIPQGF